MPRQKENSRAFIPASHLEFCIFSAAKERFPEFDNNLRTSLSARTLDRLEGTLRVLIGMASDGIVSASQRFIAARRGKSDRALRNDLRDLEALGLLETNQNYDASNLRVSNTYRIAPHVWMWRKGKQRIEAASRAIVKATEGLTSRMVRRAKLLHEAYRKAAEQNLLQGKERRSSSTERNLAAELSTFIFNKGTENNKQTATPPTTALIAQFVKLVRQLGFTAASRITKSIPEKLHRELYEANKHIE